MADALQASAIEQLFTHARTHNVLGSYLHGSLLPKNPAVADWLLARAVERAGGIPLNGETPAYVRDVLRRWRP